MTITLRTYQSRAVDAFLKSRHKSVLLVAPTGAGKGTIAAWVMRHYARQRKRVLFLVHRRELVHDMTARLERIGVRVAQTLRSDRMVRVVSVQAALRMETLPVDLLVVDEAHHYAADEWQGVIERCQAKRILGFTATPERSDGRPLGDMFREIVEVVPYSELLRRGYIVPCRVLRPQRRMDADEIAQDPVDAYLRYGERERCIVYVRRIAEADEVAARLSREGVPTGVVTSATDKALRDETMARLERGDLDVVVNVGVLTEGVDVPHVTCLVLARPCSHASIYLQIVGRALRAAEGKRIATLIDLVGASYRHGLPAEDRIYQLTGDHGIDVKRRSGSSGPSGERDGGEIENLGLDLVEVTPAGFARRIPLPPPPPAPEPLADADAEPVYPAPRNERRRWKTDLDAWKAQRASMTPDERRAVFTPKRAGGVAAKGAAAITAGSAYCDRGFWFLQWSEYGKKKRMGLATRSEAEAAELLAYFQENGPDALRDAVRIRKRTGCCLDLARGKGKRKYQLVTWNDDRTRKIRIGLGTDDKQEAERLLALYKAGDMAEFGRCVAAHRAQAAATARARISAGVRRRMHHEGRGRGGAAAE